MLCPVSVTYLFLAIPYHQLDIACVSEAKKVQEHSEFFGLQIQNPTRMDLGAGPFNGLANRLRPQ